MACAVLAAPRPGRAEVAVNVFGFSKHFKESADGPMREFNPGAGLQWTFAQSRRGSLETNVGVYSDSFGHAAWHWSLGGRWRVQGPFELGLQLINGASASHNEGYPVLVPYPFVAARLNRVTLNIAYLPEAGGVNGVPALATYVTVRPWRQSSEEKASATADSVSHSAIEFGLRYLGMYNNLGTSGITWRHMFDEGHGLRMGFDLNGSIGKFQYAAGRTASDGSYEGSLLLQYLRRYATRGRVRPYWASGLEVFYDTDDDLNDLDQSWRSSVGFEYPLDEGMFLAFEYELDATYMRSRRLDERGGVVNEERGWHVSSTGAHLALVIERGAAGPTTGARDAGHGGGLVFGVQGLTLTEISEATIAWRKLQGPTRAWRYAISQVFQSDRRADTRTQESAARDIIDFTVRAERHFRRPASDRLTTYWGVGPLVGFRYSDYAYTDHEGTESGDIRRAFRFGGTALVGAEYTFVANLYAFAEYSVDLDWRRTAWDDAVMKELTLEGKPVRLGLGTQF